MIGLKKAPVERPPITATTSRTFYHGGLPEGFDFNSLDPLRLAGRQNTNGQGYAGFYMSESPEFSMGYAKENGSALHQLKFPQDMRIKLYDNNITRVEQGVLKDLIDQGYDMIQGRNPSGRMEYILLNPSKIVGSQVVDSSLLETIKRGASKLGKVASPVLGAIGNWGMIQDALDFANNQELAYRNEWEG